MPAAMPAAMPAVMVAAALPEAPRVVADHRPPAVQETLLSEELRWEVRGIVSRGVGMPLLTGFKWEVRSVGGAAARDLCNSVLPAWEGECAGTWAVARR